jgi:L-seryl-tRNA(Ser) seleniumtransferase
LPTYLVALRVPSPDALAHRLRTSEPAVVGRIEGERFVLDLRTVLPEEEAALRAAVQRAVLERAGPS